MPQFTHPVFSDGIGSIELIDSMGTDLSIVNAARVSFASSSDRLSDKDKNLIKYLIEHKHWSPFRGVVFQFRVVAPLFVCRQWFKHVIASSYVDDQLQWNERSFRYLTIEKPEYYRPALFRNQSKNNKQCSEGIHPAQDYCASIYERGVMNLYNDYKLLIKAGVAREQARDMLPVCFYTGFVWTVSYQALINFLFLRNSEEAQEEIRCYASKIEEIITEIVPFSFNLLKNQAN
ncbi:MAG: FAD-dependent thymidylate synthase [Xenococcaceae cyanobacterium]